MLQRERDYYPGYGFIAERVLAAQKQQGVPERQKHSSKLQFALVAQLDRATDYESVGREFESLQARHKNSGLQLIL